MAMNPDPANGASQGRGRPVAADLVARARNGDKQAWDALVERYACAVPESGVCSDLLVYARRSCSSASLICSWSGRSAGWRS